MYADWQSHMGLVRHTARKHLRPGVTMDELCTVGMTGLWQAAERFDPERGVAFTVFATPRINGEIADFIRITFGRHGDHARTESLTGAVACRDKGMAAVDARDELAARTREPIEHQRKGHARLVTWRGETMPLNRWARRLGFTQPGLIGRMDNWGISAAFRRSRQCRKAS